MGFAAFRLAMFLAMAAVWIPLNGGKSHKIRIIVPHKISYIHHHHRPDPVHHHRTTDHEDEEEESGEASEEEERLEHDEEESDAAGAPHYATPGHWSDALRLEPEFLYNDLRRTRRPKRYRYLRYEDNLRWLRFPEEEYRLRDFDFK